MLHIKISLISKWLFAYLFLDSYTDKSGNEVCHASPSGIGHFTGTGTGYMLKSPFLNMCDEREIRKGLALMFISPSLCYGHQNLAWNILELCGCFLNIIERTMTSPKFLIFVSLLRSLYSYLIWKLTFKANQIWPPWYVDFQEDSAHRFLRRF